MTKTTGKWIREVISDKCRVYKNGDIYIWYYGWKLAKYEIGMGKDKKSFFSLKDAKAYAETL